MNCALLLNKRFPFFVRRFEAMNSTVIGCGWLGLPLAKRLVKEGHSVCGTVRHVNKLELLEENGIVPLIYSGEIGADLQQQLAHTEVLIICFPPSGSADYPGQIAELIANTSPTATVIFTSSTGVYKENDGMTDEKSAVISDHPVYLAEEQIRNMCADRHCILRLGGLFGDQRHPVKFMAGRSGLANGGAPVNLVHLQDVINAILTVLSQHLRGATYNVVHPEHPGREAYYAEMAGKLQLPMPEFTQDQSYGKTVSGEKITRETGFIYCFSLYEL